MMHSLFTAEFYIQNRRKLIQSLNVDKPVILTANGLLQRNSDNTFPFVQDSNFWYLTGVDLPDIILVIDGGQEFLIVPGRSSSRESFDGAVDKHQLTAVSGIKMIYDDSEGWERLEAMIKRSQSYYTATAMQPYVEQYGMYVNPSRGRLSERIAALSSGVEIIDIRKNLALLRMVKQPAEIAALQQAIDITNDSLTVLTGQDRFAKYEYEYQFEADLGREFRYRGAAGHSFAPIVAGGKRACTLHNVANASAFETDTLVVIDVGAEVSHYAADITRTRVYGLPSLRQQQVFDAVLDVQQYALGLLRAGAILREYEQAVETYMGKVLQELGLIKKANHDDIRTYFPHATSHFLGLDVHDTGDYELPLSENVVITCEPGIYIPEESIGVRLEDDVLITAAGNTVMSAALPKTLM